MTAVSEPAVLAEVPGWMSAEMPPGYRTRLLEIERLSAELRAMDAIGCLLWESGDPLREAVARVFVELRCDVDVPGGTQPIAVRLGNSHRLLLVVSQAPGPLDKTSAEVMHAFQAVQFGGPNDRVVLVAHGDPAVIPADRPEPVLPEAVALLEKMGVVIASTVTVFRLWRLSLEDAQKARKALDRLQAQEGGIFSLPTRP